MLKFAATQILGEPVIHDRHQPLIKDAHRHEFNYEPRPGYLYVRSRMISSRTNDNFDEFPGEEIVGDGRRTGYKTFLGKPVFVNHHNHDHRRMRGVIIDAALHDDRTPDGKPDIWTEGLQEIDALTYPRLAKAIIKRWIERTSMGVDVDHSICSACGNKATTPLEYCRHVPGSKGRTFYRVTASGQKVGVLIREACFGLRFFENSLLVEEPADPTAYFLGNVEMGPGLEHLSKAASREAVPVISPPPRPVVHVAYTPMMDEPLFEDTGLQIEAAGPRYKNPGEHPFFQANPVHHGNVVQHWDQANDDEKNQGKRWYEDAHTLASGLSAVTGHSIHQAAGLLAVYSPQQGWAGNMHNAARVMKEGKGIGGPGSGMFASHQQRKSADRILSGEHYNDVLGGHKVRDFAHLIEHGGDEHPDHPHVVVDRHALSVATGKRMSDADYGSFPKTQRHYYGHVVNAYHDAARHIGGRDGEDVHGHQVQAVTWLVRQRLNQEQERAHAETGADTRLDRGREVSRSKAEQHWDQYRSLHFPDLPHTGPGTGYQAKLGYGETKAPNNVDTLRDENCPICGEQDAWDGDMCAVCGFVAPPKVFQDPDLEKARKIDLRQQESDFNEAYDPKATSEAEGQMLVCSNCGEEFPVGEATTVTTEEPEDEQMGEDVAGMDEGDVCPACGKGVLEAAEMPEEELGEEGEPGEEMTDEEEGPQFGERNPEAEPEDEDEEQPPEDEEEPEPGEEEAEKEQAEEEDEEEQPPAKKKRNPFK